jgi:CheY-like chemotaxis protein
VGQLAAGVMHDVNNALNPIMAAAYLLDVHADDPSAVRSYAQRIKHAAETGAATAARVGRFIRQEPLQGEREEIVDLSAICEEVVAMTQPMWEERAAGGAVELHRDFADNAAMHGIPGELREVLLNLVQNALDAMAGAGGTLTLRTRVTTAHVVMEVADTGAGMSADVRDRAFEPFFTTKGSAGTGLGLAEVYGIVRRHRGTAQIESLPGVGTTIRLIFPLSRKNAGPAQSASQAVRQPRRVLLVEDHPDSREFMQALLRAAGHTVQAASGLEEALNVLRTATEPFEVLVTDLGLPDGSGWQVVAAARELFAGIRVGVVTGWEPTKPEKGPDVDFALRKPVSAVELLALVADDQGVSHGNRSGTDPLRE